jgi:radical SAM superfamily enzyme YgiQ (UPF0313 family)
MAMLERNAVIKDPRNKLRVALVYPNLYKIGMSNLGYQLLYDLLNSREDIYCERFFMDFDRSLETNASLRDFDVIAFSWQFELDALNVLRILHRNGLPIRREARDHLVIAGGPCAVNPYPMRNFVDLFYIGEAEVNLLPLLDAWMAVKSKDGLEELTLKGVYVSEEDNPVERVYLKDLDSYHPTAQIMSPGAAFGESFLLEASRGCAMGCRFCMGGFIFRPRRERNLARLMEITEDGIKACNPEKIAVLGASISDYTKAEELCQYLLEKGLQISIPSLRADSLSRGMVQALARSGQRSLTLAPESSQRLRCAAKKGITDAEVLNAANLAFDSGIERVKLYFMLGLPGETEEDIREIVNLVRSIKGRVKLSVNPFVPKPHTPYQWVKFANQRVLKERMKLLKKELKNCTFEDPKESFLQATIARGDEALGRILGRALEHGFGLGAFRRAFKEEGVDFHHYVREREPGEPLPWDKINVGTKKTGLNREYSRALDALATC